MENAEVRTPWHLWVVGVLSLMWNTFGCYDYTMTKLDSETYMRGMGMSDEAMVRIARTDADSSPR